MHPRGTRLTYKPWRSVVLLLALALLAVACAGDGSDTAPPAAGGDTPATQDGAQEDDQGADDGAAAFYQSETMDFIVPYNPGGGFDTYARGLAPCLEEELGGTVSVRNVPGAGGLIGANETFTADPDGLTIGLINYPGAIFAELTGQEGAQFENTKWNVLGRVAGVNPVIYTGKNSGYETAEDVLGSEDEVVVGLGGVGSDAYYGVIATAKTLGFPYRLVTGYEGSGEADAALIAGEVEAGINSLDSAMPLIENGDANPVMYVGNERAEDIPDTPTVIELAEDAEAEGVLRALASIYDLERILVTGPEVPEDRVAFLREATLAAMESDCFQTAMEQADRSLNILGGDEAQQRIGAVGDQVDRLRPLLEE